MKFPGVVSWIEYIYIAMSGMKISFVAQTVYNKGIRWKIPFWLFYEDLISGVVKSTTACSYKIIELHNYEFIED